MDSPPEQGPVGRGDTQHGAAGVAAMVEEGSPRETLTILPHHTSCGGGTRTSGYNLCLCNGCVLHEWLFSVLCLQDGISLGFLVLPCAALHSSSGAELGLSHLVDSMGNV